MTKFTSEIEKELILCAENGMTQQDAAAFVGIHPSTLSKWLKQGEKAKRGKVHNFYLKWHKSTVKFKIYHFDKIIKASDNGDINASKYIYEDCLRKEALLKEEENNSESNTNELVTGFFKHFDKFNIEAEKQYKKED